MKRKYKFHVSIGYANANREEIVEIEFEGNETEEEIEEILKEEYDAWLYNFLDTGWYEVE